MVRRGSPRGSIDYSRRKSGLPATDQTGLRLPVLVIAEEMTLVAVVNGGGEEEFDHLHVAHLLKAAVRRIHSTTHDAKALSRDLLAQEVILGKVDLLVKAPQFGESPCIEQHEHSCAEGLVQPRKMLEDVVSKIDGLVE